MKKKNIGVLITDHNYREMLDTCDYSYVLHGGAIIAEGSKAQILPVLAQRHHILDEFQLEKIIDVQSIHVVVNTVQSLFHHMNFLYPVVIIYSVFCHLLKLCLKTLK
jgi:ABC-type multidrug transport system ATPase subunit